MQYAHILNPNASCNSGLHLPPRSLIDCLSSRFPAVSMNLAAHLSNGTIIYLVGVFGGPVPDTANDPSGAKSPCPGVGYFWIGQASREGARAHPPTRWRTRAQSAKLHNNGAKRGGALSDRPPRPHHYPELHPRARASEDRTVFGDVHVPLIAWDIT